METLRYKIASIPPDLEAHLEKSLESVPHVHAVRVEPGTSCVLVEHDGADSTEVLAALREEGVELRQ